MPSSMIVKQLRVGLFFVSASLCAWSFYPGAPPAAAEGIFKNLQVLPKDIDKPKLKAIMKSQAKALGVECDYCHEQPNMDQDTDKKKIAREMMRLTDAINKGTLDLDKKPEGSKELVRAHAFYKKHLSGKKDITCLTCHEGHEEPPKSKTKAQKDEK